MLEFRTAAASNNLLELERLSLREDFNIKESVKRISGTYVFSKPIWECIEKDDWKKYSIYSNDEVQSAFCSTNTVRFNTDNAENERVIKTQKCADLSFTPFGMAEVLQRSQDLKEKHSIKNI